MKIYYETYESEIDGNKVNLSFCYSERDKPFLYELRKEHFEKNHFPKRIRLVSSECVDTSKCKNTIKKGGKLYGSRS